jgi:hypothetical protein
MHVKHVTSKVSPSVADVAELSDNMAFGSQNYKGYGELHKWALEEDIDHGRRSACPSRHETDDCVLDRNRYLVARSKFGDAGARVLRSAAWWLALPPSVPRRPPSSTTR